MRIAYIAAGAGGSYCGACARDVTLVRGLMDRRHDVLMMALYTPLTTDEPDPSIDRVFYGGINTYLQQHTALFRHTPAFLDQQLDRPGLLRLVSKHAVETEPEHLGAMTVSVLRGEHGRQVKELQQVVSFLEAEFRPEVVNLTNSLLSGLAPAIRSRLDVPVVCTLQGEELFVERLGEGYREQALAALRENAGAIDRFISPGRRYADQMAAFLQVERDRISVVRGGLDATVYCPAERPAVPPFRVGYLSRLVPAKGIDLLCEAFRLLAQRRSEPVVLAVAGQASRAGRRLWRGLQRAFRREGLADRVSYAGDVSRDEKIAFLRRCHAFSVPSRHPERRGMAALEALACGVPVVLPAVAGYDELVEVTGGGVLVEPDDPRALADGIETLLDRQDHAAALAEAGRAAVVQHFSAPEMVSQTLDVYHTVLSQARS